MKKYILITILGAMPILTLANDGSNLDKIAKSYNQTLKKYNSMDANQSDKIKERLQILSGNEVAAQNVSTTFNFYDTSTYEVYTKPNFITTIKLNSDEELIYIGGGDTENWQIDDVRGGRDNSIQVIVKPLFPNLKTNLNITTNKRRYLVNLFSTTGSYNPLVQFAYPYEAKIAHYKDSDGISLAVSSASELDFGYKWSKKESFSPEQVYNDGVKTIVVLPQKLQETPVVYGYGEDGQLTLINFRQNDNKIIIDKVLSKLQLVLGKKMVEVSK